MSGISINSSGASLVALRNRHLIGDQLEEAHSLTAAKLFAPQTTAERAVSSTAMKG
ncbi:MULTISPECIES: hypothetical protein [unclassified Streptomyces]|uniref:FXSXX-COOH protein n=1 Tax=Streptomyces sp. NBC_00180 TaxID=2903632 RepID=A0AAU1HWL3_9ACTN|nr:hypothetical protein OG331_22610 [Streptomyces sp. NBC_01017]